ncbi:hypothetical protein VKT23_017872 [Stygiomarasmius scandens]|uniref:Uncharacterized protein n=1 Tax=Marasmiellus scandens TaxID=2682957 RepID=A0ABR1IUV5_9AGAR
MMVKKPAHWGASGPLLPATQTPLTPPNTPAKRHSGRTRKASARAADAAESMFMEPPTTPPKRKVSKINAPPAPRKSKRTKMLDDFEEDPELINPSQTEDQQDTPQIQSSDLEGTFG